MKTMAGGLTRVGVVLLVLAAWPARAQEAVRVRGTIERVEGQTLLVTSRDGAKLKVVLADQAVLVGIVKASLADIRPGSFVGVTGLPRPDGSEQALEVHIFPESMRGTGEGQRPWDLRPQSVMTNAYVEQTVASIDGPMLLLKHKDGQTWVLVAPDTPIVTYALGDRSELKPGTKVFISGARKLPDGAVEAPRMNFGRTGSLRQCNRAPHPPTPHRDAGHTARSRRARWWSARGRGMPQRALHGSA
jgi:hypothetical protein